MIPELLSRLRAGAAAVLQAPPGAGKTTRVPLALLGEPWLAGGRVVMLEPRRLAARGAAAHMAALCGERVGETVGYRVRNDTRVGPHTRVEVVTEGVLTRMLQSDPALEGVGAVIFDEYHERSLHGELGLALALQSQALLRPELRLLVMSATLDGEAVAGLLGDAPVVTSTGRSYPVEVRYLERRREGFVEPLVASTVLRALEESEGDVLVFLPGAAEIRRVEERLREAAPPGVRVHPLYGALSQEAQDAAVRAGRPGERKVVLSTSIAETSLTIEGVRVVVDSGLARVPRFSPRTGMTRLETVTVSAASAEQRRGRAGRLAPGLCYRLWTEAEQAGLVPHALPEILEADLAPLALELAAWGVADPATLRWLDPPPAAAVAQGRELLRELGALDAGGAITPHGRAMAELPAHPRIGHLLLRARERGLGALGCTLAALLEERDPLRASGPALPDADVRLRLEALRGGGRGADGGALARIREQARQWRRQLGVADAALDPEAAGALLALAYPDRVAAAREGGAGRFLLRNGRGAALSHPQALSPEPWLAVAEVDGRGAESRILLAAPVSLAELLELFGDQVERHRSVAWDAAAGAVRGWSRDALGALALREAQLGDLDAEEVVQAVLDEVCASGLQLLHWSDEARRTRERLAFAHHLDPAGWPDVSDAALLAGLDGWLRPQLYGVRRGEELQRLDLGALLLGTLPWSRRAELDSLAPTYLEVPSGSRVPIDYGDPEAPVLAVRLQELFGMTETPRVGGGRVPLVVHLLSPARRPVQVTRDLASFWCGAYYEVRKDLRGRYPKHHWPDDPLQATPTSRAKRRGT